MKLSLKLALKLSVLSHGNIAFDEISPRHVSIRIRYCFSLCFPAGKFSIFRATPVSHRRKSGISEMFGLFFFWFRSRAVFQSFFVCWYFMRTDRIPKANSVFGTGRTVVMSIVSNVILVWFAYSWTWVHNFQTQSKPVYKLMAPV